MRRAAVLALEGLGYRVLPAESGEEAVLLYREHHEDIDAVLLDIVMPGMDGFAFARTLREGGPWRDLPLIALSGRAEPADVEPAEEAEPAAGTAEQEH